MRVKRGIWLALALALSGCGGLPCERDAGYLDARQPPGPILPAGVASRPLVDLDSVPAPSATSRNPRKRGDGTCLSTPPPPAAVDKDPSSTGG